MSADASATAGAAPHASDPQAPASAGRGGVLFGAAIAAATSIGLAWWLGADDGGRIENPTAPTVVASPPQLQPSPIVDEAQVHRAYEQFQTLYADGGLANLLQASRNCARALQEDPRILDFCLALDMYVSTLAPQGAAQDAWFRTAAERRLTLARAALADAEAAPVRIAAIERLTRIAAPRPGTSPSPPAEVQRPAPASSPPSASNARSERTVSARTAAERPRPAPPPRRPRCDTATAAGRALCSSPALQRADREMLRAYDRALAAGIDEHRLNRQQARWRRAVNVAGGDREALARLYERRIWELNADARARE